MIPKKIHYCWLSGEKLPPKLKKCIDGWRRKLPEYELVLWDQNKFDVNSIEYVKKACSLQKWAAASDYIRLYALFTEGGIYLDSDVIIRKSMSEFLKLGFFSGIECHAGSYDSPELKLYLNEDGSSKKPFTPVPGIGIQAAIMGAHPNHPFVKDCMSWYENSNPQVIEDTIYSKIIAPAIIAMTAEKYGFVYTDKEQILNDSISLFDSSIFAPNLSATTADSVAIHCCEASWKKGKIKNLNDLYWFMFKKTYLFNRYLYF